SIEQKTTSRNPRSTVGTVTEIYDYMRLLWARVGVPYSPATGLPIESQTVSQMVDRVMALPEGTRIYLLAPVVRGRKGEYRKDLAEFLKRGFQRVKIDGKFYEIANAPALDKKLKHDLDVVVDRLVVRPDIKTRLADSFETALHLADGLAVIEFADGAPEAVKKEGMKRGHQGDPNRIVFSQKFACPVSGFTIEEIEPRLFSFNSPHGACPSCDGLGEDASPGRDRAVVALVVALLSADARSARAEVQILAEYFVEGSAEENPRHDPLRLRRRGREVHLRRRRALVRDEKAVRGRDRQSGAPLSRDRKRLGARGHREILLFHPLQGLQRLSPQARGARGQDRRPAYRRSDRAFGEGRARMVRGAAEKAHAEAERDRRSRAEGDPRAAHLPRGRGPRLSDARARLRHAVRRREPAHPARLADRLGPHGRPVRPRRAVDRLAPARQ